MSLELSAECMTTAFPHSDSDCVFPSLFRRTLLMMASGFLTCFEDNWREIQHFLFWLWVFCPFPLFLRLVSSILPFSPKSSVVGLDPEKPTRLFRRQPFPLSPQFQWPLFSVTLRQTMEVISLLLFLFLSFFVNYDPISRFLA